MRIILHWGFRGHSSSNLFYQPHLVFARLATAGISCDGACIARAALCPTPHSGSAGEQRCLSQCWTFPKPTGYQRHFPRYPIFRCSQRRGYMVLYSSLFSGERTMDIKRRLQVGAAAVIANSLLALIAMSPNTALANPCAPKTACLGACGGQATAFCNFNNPPGCTSTSLTCTPGQGCSVPHVFSVVCFYN